MHLDDSLATCSFDVMRKLIGDKWKFTIICNLFGGSLNYGELLSEIDQISKKVLTENLKELEKLGIIEKETYKDKNINKVSYELTDVGKSIKPIFNDILLWGNAYSRLFYPEIYNDDQ